MTFRIYIRKLTIAVFAILQHLTCVVDGIAEFQELGDIQRNVDYGFTYYYGSPIFTLAERIVELKDDNPFRPEQAKLAESFIQFVDTHADQMDEYANAAYNHCSPVITMLEKWMQSEISTIREKAYSLDDVAPLINDPYQIVRAENTLVNRVRDLNDFISELFCMII